MLGTGLDEEDGGWPGDAFTHSIIPSTPTSGRPSPPHLSRQPATSHNSSFRGMQSFFSSVGGFDGTLLTMRWAPASSEDWRHLTVFCLSLAAEFPWLAAHFTAGKPSKSHDRIASCMSMRMKMKDSSAYYICKER